MELSQIPNDPANISLLEGRALMATHLPADGAAPPRGMTICDGRGGALSLDLASPELALLAEACRRLLGSQLPPGASALKVSAAGNVYLLSARALADGVAGIQISNLYDPAERITLTHDLAEIVVALLEQRLRG